MWWKTKTLVRLPTATLTGSKCNGGRIMANKGGYKWVPASRAKHGVVNQMFVDPESSVFHLYE